MFVAVSSNTDDDSKSNLSVLQSGLTESRISFTSSLPYGDVRRVYNDILFGLEGNTKLSVFRDINAFERNYFELFKRNFFKISI